MFENAHWMRKMVKPALLLAFICGLPAGTALWAATQSWLALLVGSLVIGASMILSFGLRLVSSSLGTENEKHFTLFWTGASLVAILFGLMPTLLYHLQFLLHESALNDTGRAHVAMVVYTLLAPTAFLGLLVVFDIIDRHTRHVHRIIAC